MTVFLLLQADDLKSVEKNDVHLLLTAAIVRVEGESLSRDANLMLEG